LSVIYKSDFIVSDQLKVRTGECLHGQLIFFPLKRYRGNGMISLTDFSYLSYSSPKILLRTLVSPWIEILNPIYKTKEMENINPEWKMSAREGIINTIMEEYIGFRQRANGPCIIRVPGLKYFRKKIAE
jgi:hypothetical protein